jgi:uncharacterized protein (TIGR02145 family)
MKNRQPQLKINWTGFLFLSLFLVLVTAGCEYILPNKPPYLKKIQPADSAMFTVGQVVDFKVEAYDVDGSVVHVVFTVPNGPEFTDSNAPYEFSWATAGMVSGYYEVAIMAVDNKDEPYIIKAPIRLIGGISAMAGRDTTFLDSRTTYVLQATASPYSEGTWTIISGTGGSISDNHNPNATLTGLPCQSYTLRWTVVSGTFQVSDEVTVRFSHQPSKAYAGADQLITDGRLTTQLQALKPVEGTGLWRILSGGVGTLGDATQPNSAFTGQACGVYNLVWTVSTLCAVSADTVEIRFDPNLVNPDAGPNQIYNDGRKTATLSANAPVTGTGTWSVISGINGQFSNINDPKAVFSGQLCQTYTLRWTIATACSTKSDDVTVTFNYTPTTANAGADRAFTGPVLSFLLDGNTPVQGSGIWTVASGSGGVFEDDRNPKSRFTGVACQSYVLKWTISTACGTSSDQMSASFTDSPSTANAGPDINMTDGSIYVTLDATPATNGTGRWTIVSGGTGSFSDINDPKAVFAGVLCHSYVLRWTVSTACSSSFDEVTVVLNQTEINADAGPDITVSDGSLSVNLQGNAPGIGMTGTWSIISGIGGIFGNVNSPASLFTGVSGQIYVLKWTLTGACIENSDEVTIAFVSGLDMTDPRDGKTYKIIKLGLQVWMAENLNYTVEGSYAYDNSAENPVVFGRLYDWGSATTACPAGWHLPSDLEWRQLEGFLGMDGSTTLLEWYRGYDEGGMLKETGTTNWNAPNAGATNLSGFTARGGGYRTPGGVYGGLKTMAGFWSSTGNTSGKAIYRALSNDRSQIGRDWYDKAYGFSVRCVKN